jgi:hypothetical protein
LASHEHADYLLTAESGSAISPYKTYETLIDLAKGQVIGTWDASKLHNQFVNTGEIMFEISDTYSGAPQAPVLNPLSLNGTNLTISWTQTRPDLINTYRVEVSYDNLNWNLFQLVNSGGTQRITQTIILGMMYYIRVIALSADGASGYSNIQSIST